MRVEKSAEKIVSFRSSRPLSCRVELEMVRRKGVQKKSSKLSRGYFLHMLPHSNNIVATHQTHPCFQTKKFGEL